MEILRKIINTLSGLTDVSFGTLENNQVLTYRDGNWINLSFSGVTISLVSIWMHTHQ
jgi:hypothetical protein